jgi:dihydroorotate dehydrogenase
VISPTGLVLPQNAAIAATAAAGGGFAYYKTTDVQKQFELASSSGPLIRLLDAETAHRAGIWAAKLGLFPKETRPDPESLHVNVWGKSFTNPIGAGYSGNSSTADML